MDPVLLLNVPPHQTEMKKEKIIGMIEKIKPISKILMPK